MTLRRTRFAATWLVLAAVLPPAQAVAQGYGGGYGRSTAPRASAPSYARALSHIELRDYGAAARELRALVGVEPRNADAWNLLGFSTHRLRDYADAGAAYAAALRIAPDHLGALGNQGELFVLMRRYDAAQANLKRLAELCGACEEHADLEQALVRAGQSSTGARRLKAPGSGS